VVALSDSGGGNGRVVVAVHGAPGTNRDWRWLAPVLLRAPNSLRLIRIDLPGHGGTPLGAARSASPADTAAFLEEALAACGLGSTTPVTLLAHSIGGHTCVQFAARFPHRVERLALVASCGLREHRGLPQRLARISFALLRAAPPALRDVLISLTSRPFFRLLGFPRSLSNAEIYTVTARASQVDWAANTAAVARLPQALPVFFAWAADDPLIQEAIFEELSSRLPASAVRVRYAHGGHAIQKTHAQDLGERLLAWMSQPRA
jgi:pimeloyl-ACP methyl ester carboxylesterase